MQFELLAGQADPHGRGFQYGDGFFTTGRTLEGCIWLKEQHIARLVKGAEAFGFELEALGVIRELESRLGAEDTGFKLIVERSGAHQARGYRPGTQKVTVWLARFEVSASHRFWQDQLEQDPVPAVVLEARLGAQPQRLAGIKSLGRAEQVLAAAELYQLAQASGQQDLEGLVCDARGQLCEGVSANLVLYANGQWLTPQMNYSGVHGNLRQALLQKGLVQECPKVPVLHEIEAALLINSVKGARILASLQSDETLHAMNPALARQFVERMQRRLA